MTDPALGGNDAQTGSAGTPGPPPPLAPQSEEPAESTAEFDACVEEIRRRYGSDIPFLLPRLEDRIRRRLEVAPLSAAAAALSGLLGIGIRLALVLLATVLVGQWAEIPWGRWAIVFLFYVCSTPLPR